MTIFVGNLNRTMREEELSNLFAQFGQVKLVKIIKDNFSGESKGYAFVDMYQESDAMDAIEQLNEKEVGGRKLTVNKARPKGDGARNGNVPFNKKGSFNGKDNYVKKSGFNQPGSFHEKSSRNKYSY